MMALPPIPARAATTTPMEAIMIAWRMCFPFQYRDHCRGERERYDGQRGMHIGSNPRNGQPRTQRTGGKYLRHARKATSLAGDAVRAMTGSSAVEGKADVIASSQ